MVMAPSFAETSGSGGIDIHLDQNLAIYRTTPSDGRSIGR
jgi:hypothetical protein